MISPSSTWNLPAQKLFIKKFEPPKGTKTRTTFSSSFPSRAVAGPFFHVAGRLERRRLPPTVHAFERRNGGSGTAQAMCQGAFGQKVSAQMVSTRFAPERMTLRDGSGRVEGRAWGARRGRARVHACMLVLGRTNCVMVPFWGCIYGRQELMVATLEFDQIKAQRARAPLARASRAKLPSWTPPEAVWTKEGERRCPLPEVVLGVL